MRPSEAIYGFAGWLTSRKKTVEMGSTRDAAVVADLVHDFIKENNLEEPRENFSKTLKYPSERLKNASP